MVYRLNILFFFLAFFVYWYNLAGFQNWREFSSEGEDWLNRNTNWSDMSLFDNFRILLGILLGPSHLSRFKKEMILEASVLSIGVIKMIQYSKAGGNHNISSWKKKKKKVGGLNIYSNFSKIIIESISHFRRIRNTNSIYLFPFSQSIKDFCILCILIGLPLFYKGYFNLINFSR